MGKVPGLKREDTSAHLVTLLIKHSSIVDLWKMETLGNMDPVEVKSKEEMEKNAVEHFMKTVDRDGKERYSLKLPWIESKEIVQANRSVAEQRCIRTSQKLKEEGKYIVYEAVFKKWFAEEVTEKVPKEIRNLSSREDWKQLPGTCNAADFPLCSCYDQGFLKSRWWQGSQWLKL
ncbi:hypothetical protein TNCT_591731 [Trichonephila clavata]|uniref:Uncharacterized protein n=1 Tax=Trichonephila clavata TaxID=2740835 RepID=A0A8X6FHQ5_TRICU|nr:hypothetical protein TNCT_591731 [Trichonephila clavata]